MKIAFLTTEFVTEPSFAGGLANYLFRLCLALKELGHNPTVFVRSDREQTIQYRGIEIHRVKLHTPLLIKLLDRFTLKNFSQPLSMISSAMALSQKLKKQHKKDPVDIVQSASYQATNLLVDKHIPRVVRISSFEPLWRKAYEKPYNTAQKLIEWMEVRALKNADAVFAPSVLIADELKRSLNLNVEVIEPPFCFDTTKFDRNIYDQNLRGKKYLLFFGTIGLMKGCKTIADMLETLLAGNPDLFFVFIGNESKYKGKSMIDYIRERAGSTCDRVLFFKPVRHEALYPIIKKAQAVILPSRIDNLPNTCLEAMSLGKIVIGTKGTSFEQMIEDGISVFLCVRDDPDSLLKRTENVLRLSESEKEQTAGNAKRRIERLNPEKAGKSLIEVYQKVILKHCTG